VWSSLLAGVLAGVARAAPLPPFGHAGRWITDARGRVVIVHGTNMVEKRPPYTPAAAGFSADDAALLARLGFNAVRVGVIWKAVEPEPGVFDDAYLERIARTVAMLARHGILSLLDFHQDQFNERFEGEGAPDWAVEDGGLPNPRLGFPGNYTGNPALQHALDAFFSNAPGPDGIGLGDRFAAAWAHVAARFRRLPTVLGYELVNEPFPGSAWATCLGATGCAFDAVLTAFSRRVAAAIRTVDSQTLVWYEPSVLFNAGFGSAVGALGDPRAGFAFHDYCPTEPQTHSPAGCDAFDDRVFAHALAHVAETGEAILLTEFGSTSDAPYLTDMLARADRTMVPWLEWSYCRCNSPTDTGDQPGLVIDPHRPPRGSNLVRGTLRALVEPYPQVIAGTPLSWGFDPAARTFTLRYTTARADGTGRFEPGATTEIATPRLVYGGRYGVRVDGGAVAVRHGGSRLEIAACPGAETIDVTVSPSGGKQGTCRVRAPQRGGPAIRSARLVSGRAH
jgi:endoglycosylceramidase